MSRPARTWPACFAVFALALAVRLGFLAAGPGWNLSSGQLGGDPKDFHAIATSLSAGTGYAMPWAGGGPHAGQLRATALRAPLFPWMLSALYRLTGPSPFAGRLLLVAVDALTCALLVPLGALLIGPLVGRVTGTLAALYPPLWVNVGTLLSEPTFTLALVLALLAAEGVRRRPSPVTVAALGVSLALVTYGRPNGLFIAVALAGWAAWRARPPGWRAAALTGGSCVAICALLVAPWIVRTALTVGEVVPVTTQGGPVLAGSYSSRMLRPGTPERGGWDVVLAVGALRRAPDEATLDRGLRQVGRRWIRAHPGGTVELVGLHAWRYFDLYWAMGDRLVTATPTPWRWANAASVLSWWAVAVCAALGLRALWRRHALGPLVPALAVYATLALSGVLLVAGTRYRAPGDVVVLLLAAAFVAGERGRRQALGVVPAGMVR